MESKQLQFFLKISEEGSFTKAAAFLDMPQPVLSRKISLLETELGVRLFYRNGRGVLLTEAGQLLQQHSKKIIHAMLLADVELEMLRGEVSGKVVVAMSSSLARSLAVPLIRRFSNECPKASISIVESLSDAIDESLQNGVIDAALAFDAPEMDAMHVEALLDEEHVLVGPAANPVRLPSGQVGRSALAQIPMIIPSRAHLEQLIDVGCPLDVRLEVSSLDTVLALVAAGAGYSILPRRCVDATSRPDGICSWRITEPPLSRKLMLVTRLAHDPLPKVAQLLKMIREEVAEQSELVRVG